VSAFRFGLQKVLELREEAEQNQALALAQAERRATEARRTLDALREIRDEEAGKLMRSHGAGRSVGQLRNFARVIEQLSERVTQAESTYAQAAEAVEESRRELVTAMTQRRVLDQLKDRKADAWKKTEAGEERKRMDELALGIFQRRANGAER